ncbi:MAG TPA: radical SAM protein [Burkholderiales bacterium]|nr:radical SAM protein [Burkholderiales bacterium]
MPSPTNVRAAGTAATLSVLDHDRDSAGLTYVYPVVSRRAGGVSVGINLNVNNACNWRCIYCQVPGLGRGAAPPVDLARLAQELEAFLGEVLHGDFLASRVPAGARRLNDIALSGNGEPTSARQFEQVVELIGGVRKRSGVPPAVKTVLITNGSLMQRPGVQAGVRKLSGMNGEVWFKLDRASEQGLRRINGTRTTLARVRANLAAAAQACPTWIQTCMFAVDAQAPGEAEQTAYLEFLRESMAQGIRPEGVLLYGLARASMQPEAAALSSLPDGWMEAFARRIRALGLPVKITP